MILGGFSISNDITCQEIIHNPIAARFLRINDWDNLSDSSDISPPAVKIYQKGKLINLEERPIQRATEFGVEVPSEEYEFIWRTVYPK